jgi:hypothetical protein
MMPVGIAGFIGDLLQLELNRWNDVTGCCNPPADLNGHRFR